jgi:ribosome-associated protein
MLFQTTDNVVPVKQKTSINKVTDRKKAVAPPRTAGLLKKSANKPKIACDLEGAGRRKSGAAMKGIGGPAKASSAKPASAKPASAKLSLKSVVTNALSDMKALEIKVLDVRGLTDIADFMVIASGTSDRHVRSVAQRVVEKTKEAGFRPHGVEGQKDSDWVLIDLNEMIVHVMLPRVREFYGLEKLWDMTTAKRAARA